MADASSEHENSDPQESPRIATLGIHPIKSLRGLEPEKWWFGPSGPDLDRRWMLVDAGRRFLSLREFPGLARFHPEIVDEVPIGAEEETPLPRLHIHHRGETLEIQPRVGDSGEEAVLWGSNRAVTDEGDVAAAWFSHRLGQPVRLVRHRPDLDLWRQPEPEADGATTGLADGYPVLVVSRTTIQAAVGPTHSARRFRPNLLIDDVAAGAEDGWLRIRVGEVEMDLVKPCVRCVATTVDPENGRRTGTEPLSILARTRRWNGRPVLGWNTLVRRPGWIRVGDPIEVLQDRSRVEIETAPLNS
ncbi:MAG: MOSC N-terminal beta barrel domain-containing protein [Planctomycetota bacterium]|nr:MOSC N-terminal beta barrel domain-containing protein [Planctomycetota bacterium]